MNENYINSSYNTGYLANVGWDETTSGNQQIDYLFSDANIESLIIAIKDALRNADPKGRPIIVSKDIVIGVLSNVYRFGTRQNIGDIYSRYIVPQEQTRCDIRTINNQVINIISSNIRNEIEMTENNKKLTVWSTLLGDFNNEGLRAHPPIKIKRRHPQYMAFNMNY
jgi:hypothetical protein